MVVTLFVVVVGFVVECFQTPAAAAFPFVEAQQQRAPVQCAAVIGGAVVVVSAFLVGASLGRRPRVVVVVVVVETKLLIG